MKSLLTLNLVVSDAIEALSFYEKVFNGVVGDVYYFPEAKGNNEANIQVGQVHLRAIDENSAYECFGPKLGEVDAMWLQMEVADVEATLKLALDNGASMTQEMSEFMGTKHVEITDPYGYVWTINQVINKITYEERYEIYKGLIVEGNQ